MRNKICQMKEQFCNFHLKICVVCTLPSRSKPKSNRMSINLKKKISISELELLEYFFFLKSSPGFLENKDDETS